MWPLVMMAQIPSGVPSADLGLVPPACPRSQEGEIVVCKPVIDPNRMGPRLSDPEPLLPAAEFRLFGKVRAAMQGEQRGVAGGATAPAAMVRFRIPL